MPDPIVNAAPATQEPISAPVNGNVDIQALPSAEAKPELIDFSALGESWKDIKVIKSIADILPQILKSEHFTPELVEHLKDPTDAKLFFTDNKGYRKTQNERFETISAKDKAIAAREKTIIEREKSLMDKERELSEIEGDSYFYRNDKVKRVAKDAVKEAEELGLEGERAQDYVNKITKPYLELAKSEHLKQKEDQEKQIDAIFAEINKIGTEMFPEFPPSIASQLLDGFVDPGSDPKSAAQLLRSELDRIIESSNARAIADYVKRLNTKQPDIPIVEPTKPTPNTSYKTARDEEISFGKALAGMFGK